MEEILMQVVEALQQGATPEEVAQTLMEQGYSEEDIQNIFMTIQQQAEGQMQEEQPPMMQEGGETNNADLMLQIASMIEQGVDINDILNQLVQQGYDQEQAAGIIEQVMVELDNQQMQQPPMEMKNGGSVPDQDIHIDRDNKFEKGGVVTLTTGKDEDKLESYTLNLKEGVKREDVEKLIEEINNLGKDGKAKKSKLAELEKKVNNPDILVEALSGVSEGSVKNVDKLSPERRFNNATLSIGGKDTPKTTSSSQPTSTNIDANLAENTGGQTTEETKSDGTKVEGTPLNLGIDLGSYDKNRYNMASIEPIMPFVLPTSTPLLLQDEYRNVQPIEVSPEREIQEIGSRLKNESDNRAVQAYSAAQEAKLMAKAITDTQMANVGLQQEADKTNLGAAMSTGQKDLALFEQYNRDANAMREGLGQRIPDSLAIQARKKKEINTNYMLSQMGDFTVNPKTGKIELDPMNLSNFINSYGGYGNQLVAQQTEEEKKKKDKSKTQTVKV